MTHKHEISLERTVAMIIDELEHNLRELDLWQSRRPPPESFRSTLPFSFDTMKLHEWLQWRLIPRMRKILREGEPLPEASAILPYAEEYFSQCKGDVTELLFAIENFDDVISGIDDSTVH